MYMYLKEVISKKLFFKLVYCWHFGKFNDEIVRGMDPRIQIRIRIHPKMSWIRNTAQQIYMQYFALGLLVVLSAGCDTL